MHAIRDFVGSTAAVNAALVGTFSPLQLSAVAAWLRFAAGTITGSGYSSVPDVLASNPATQGTDAQRPPNVNTAGGFPQGDFQTAQFLTWPAAANNNQTSQWGIAFWLLPDTIGSQRGIFSSRLVTASDRMECFHLATGGDLIFDVYITQFVARRATTAGLLSAASRLFLTIEFDGTQSTDDLKCTITKNAIIQSPTFSDASGTPGAMPSSLVATTNVTVIGARSAAPNQPFDGKIGPNVWILGSKMPGATQGLLTTAARTALMNFEGS